MYSKGQKLEIASLCSGSVINPSHIGRPCVVTEVSKGEGFNLVYRVSIDCIDGSTLSQWVHSNTLRERSVKVEPIVFPTLTSDTWFQVKFVRKGGINPEDTILVPPAPAFDWYKEGTVRCAKWRTFLSEVDEEWSLVPRNLSFPVFEPMFEFYIKRQQEQMRS